MKVLRKRYAEKEFLKKNIISVVLHFTTFSFFLPSLSNTLSYNDTFVVHFI